MGLIQEIIDEKNRFEALNYLPAKTLKINPEYLLEALTEVDDRNPIAFSVGVTGMELLGLRIERDENIISFEISSESHARNTSLREVRDYSDLMSSGLMSMINTNAIFENDREYFFDTFREVDGTYMQQAAEQIQTSVTALARSMMEDDGNWITNWIRESSNRNL